ncbi:Clp protease ClpP [Companilactobacillus allii]|uniref:ATP-dependent Clp protease proteolytic subunit n=1 Tax=Companilactobacillus allii TaxID=1847728 RepID=A0A1P8Q5L2_9LACO|nr:head maturation protease, ClpP-related [Companilactobacillus allii]APX73119.1 hypothetical protein BTM29_11395 [Companilactobacillus allii]USQ67920.1 Clp protease ClpP [Companilactobacillus allii]
MTIKVTGSIVPNNYGVMYDFLGLDYTSPRKVQDSLNDANGEDVDVVINSGGGDVFSGSEIYSSLKEYSGSVNVKIYGLAASAASVIAMAGDKVSMSPTAQLMIHNVKSGQQGDYRDMDHMSDVLKNNNSALANAYTAKTNMNKDDILNLMNDETWLTADEAVDKGFADEVLFLQDKQPVLTNSLEPMFSDEALNKFLNLVNKASKADKDKEKEDEPNKDKPDKDKSTEEKPDSDKEYEPDKTKKSDPDKDKKKEKTNSLKSELELMKMRGHLYEY